MNKKMNFKDFINFKLLITESVVKWLFIIFCVLSALATVISIFIGWFGAFQVISFNFGYFLLAFIGTPIIAIISLFFTIFFFRLACESILVRFLTYRELKEVKEKMKD